MLQREKKSENMKRRRLTSRDDDEESNAWSAFSDVSTSSIVIIQKGRGGLGLSENLSSSRSCRLDWVAIIIAPNAEGMKEKGDERR